MSRGEAFPGGCFFASVAAEVDTHPVPVRDVAVQVLHDWLALLERHRAGGAGRGRRSTLPEDADQLGFEIEAYLLLANALFVASRSDMALDRARRALDTRLACAAPSA